MTDSTTAAAARPARKPARAKRTAFTARKRAIFFAEIGRTCNITAAAKAAGLSESSVYRHRSRSAPFRAEWERALKDGYQTLETRVLARALVESGGEAAGEPGRDKLSRQADGVAMRLLAAHRPAVTGELPARRGGRASKPAREIVAARYLKIVGEPLE